MYGGLATTASNFRPSTSACPTSASRSCAAACAYRSPVSFALASREAVDEIVERAAAAGGRIGDTDDYPFMYQRQFDDPDGYHYSPFWMKPDADPTA